MATRHLIIPITLFLLFSGIIFFTQLDVTNTATPATIHTALDNEKISSNYLVGQSAILGIEGTRLHQEEKDIIRTYGIGGIILLEKNISSEKQLISLTNEIYTLAEEHAIPKPFIAIDQEGGDVSRITFEETASIPQYRIGDDAEAFNIAYRRAKNLLNLGITMNLSPVVDPIEEETSFLWNRTFQRSAPLIRSLAAAMIEGYRKGGVTPVLKHFPGHTNSSEDSHLTSSHSFSLNTETTTHFSSLFASTYIPALMTSHTIHPPYTTPASLSKETINFLKKDLLYTGLIITDDLEMSGLSSFLLKQRAKKALLAGNDMILFSGYKYGNAIHKDILSYLSDELEINKELEQKLKNSYQKITSYKIQHLK